MVSYPLVLRLGFRSESQILGERAAHFDAWGVVFFELEDEIRL